MKFAEKQVKGTRLKKHYWSPALRNAGLLCRYWHLRIYAIREHRDTTRSILRLQEMIQQHEPSYQFLRQQENLPLSEMVKCWKDAKKALKECQSEARELCYRSYEDMLVHYEVESSPESRRRASIVRRTLRTERCRETYRSIRLSTKPLGEHTGGLQSILIPHIENTGITEPNIDETTGSKISTDGFPNTRKDHEGGNVLSCGRKSKTISYNTTKLLSGLQPHRHADTVPF